MIFLDNLYSYSLFLCLCCLLYIKWRRTKSRCFGVSRKSNAFLDALVEENYQDASLYLSCYGKSDVDEARENWASQMQMTGLDIVSIEKNRLLVDDGIVCCCVWLYLSDGDIIEFGLSVQGKGLAISSTYAPNDPDLTDDLQNLLTSHHPG